MQMKRHRIQYPASLKQKTEKKMFSCRILNHTIELQLKRVIEKEIESSLICLSSYNRR
jgi:hypothetical protein